MKNTVEYEYTSHGLDPVTTQYGLLPYPPVNDIELNAEKQHYQQNTHTKAFFPQHALENINHYLHQGEENFA